METKQPVSPIQNDLLNKQCFVRIATEHAASLRMLDDPRIVSESDTSFYEASDTDGDDDPEEFIQNKKLKRDKAIKKKEAECIFQCMDCALSFASKGSYFFHLRHTHNQHKIPFRSRGLDTKNKDFIPDFEQDTIEDITIHHVETQVQDQPKITAATTQKKVLVDSHVNAPSSEESLDEEDVSIKEPMIPITLPATRLPFYCQLCNRLELNEIRYQLHMQLYHAKSTTSIRSDKKENAGEAYQCPICDIVKPNRRSYLKHLSIIHKQVPSPK
ncbi:hypothetical protein BDF20DRAFT_890317 [Mycotypha africana]|uniref:uncharacterized protein n=1 Tax=Mycotypha africana TaxID=64632 RepID=UPI0023006CC9|nr:uncharacterized protein BDF20DRAFT_890317 [Mycotypha africana]KAI8970284.1 hypothetical protein BDF20DRAFT_890317 [Mycotypha africana]